MTLVRLALILTLTGFLGFSAFSQTVSGKVTDNSGTPLIGVNILLENTTQGTTSDFNGEYELDINGLELPIVFTYIGYRTIRINPEGRTSLNVTMEADEKLIDEVVIIGYGEVKKRDLIGSVGSIGAKEISTQAITSYNQALAGQIAGVQIRQGNGAPGGGPEFLIRGVNSISPQSAPLIVIDDIPIGNYNAESDNFLALINPNDIASISVIKDASGKAIYGSRAANGLVIIKTKSGRAGPPKITYSPSFAVQTIPSWEVPNIMNATELATFHRERFQDDYFSSNGEFPTDDLIPEHLQDPSSYGIGTDWFGALTRNAPMHRHDLNLDGGTKDMNYKVSFGYLNQDGVVIESNLKRYSMRVNVNAKVKPWLDLNLRVAPSWTDNQLGNFNPGRGQFSVYNVLNIAKWADPSAPLYDKQGNLTRDTKGELTQFFQVNPVRKAREWKQNKYNRSVQASLGGIVKLYDGLKFKSTASTFYFNNRGRTFRPADINAAGLEPAFNNIQAASSTGRYENLRLLLENQLLYNKSFKSGHNFDVLLGYSAELTRETTLGSSTNRVVNEDFELINSGNNVPTFDENDPEKETRIYFNTSEGESEQALLSYIGRIQYNYKGKYYIHGAVRRDGSSRFGRNNRYGVFPSISFAYRVSNEKWFPKGGLVSNLKFEFVTGKSGNNRIGNFAYQGRVGGADYIIGGGLAEGSAVGGLQNFDLKWEETNQLDLGIDIGLLKDRVNIEVDVYRARTTDLLFGTPLPRVTGFGSRIDNLGDIENRGIEIGVNATPILKSKFSWNINANFAINENEVLAIGEADRPVFGTRAGNGTSASITQVGGPIGQFRGLKILGLYTEEMLADESVPKYPGAVVGAPFYEDFNGDGVLDRENDIQLLDSPWEKFSYGMTNTLNYAGFNLKIAIYGNYGSKILDLSREFLQNTDQGNGDLQGVFNLDREVIGRWRPGDTDFGVRPPSTATAASSQRWRWPNSTGIKSGSFLKINNVSLSYDFGRLLNDSKIFRNLSAYVSVQNLAYITSYNGNPEVRRPGGALERNVNYSSYPVPRTFTFGMNIGL